MTVQVKVSDTLESGIEAIKEASIEDYNNMWARDDMRKEYAEGFSYSVGKKYIKMISTPGSRSSVFCFIVATDSDKKFRKGDVLKPDGWKTPARNKARGNIFDGDFPMAWTGPLYLIGLGSK